MEIALLACNRFELMVETGTSAWGCDSSRLLDLVARKNDATFLSVDIRPEASLWLRHQVSRKTFFHVQDSIDFFKSTFQKTYNRAIDFAYLDSFDLDFSNPEPSELHCLQEFKNVCRFSRVGTIILIDDTPATLEEVPESFRELAKEYLEKNGRVPGKGSLVRDLVRSDPSFQILWNSENLVIRILRSNPLREIKGL